MSFFTTIKRALGFGDDVDSEIDDLLADTPESSPGESEVTTARTGDAPDTPAAPEFAPEVQKEIFGRVLDVFNASLPDFLAASADREAQEKYLYEALDEGIREYLDKLMAAANACSEARWKQRQATLTAELDAVREKAADVEKQSTDIKQKQLSADRQKRALSERVHDLEQQVARLDSEREQFELENRSLVNRIKVAGIQGEDLEKAQEQIASLQKEIKALRSNPEAVALAECDQLRAKLDKAEAENAELRKGATEMSEGIDSLKEQIRVADEMQKDLRHRAAEAGRTADGLKADLDERDARIAELQKALDEMNEVAARFDELDQVLVQKEDKIKSCKRTIAARDLEIEALKGTIAENLKLQAEREKALQDELKALRPPTVVAEMTVDFGEVTEDSAPRISEDELSALEETFETDEWFTKTPPPETPSMRSAESEADFGYKAPRRKQTTTPPGQLSLF